MNCVSCERELQTEDEVRRDVCDDCYRDPNVNNCEKCGVHLQGIPYPYVCGKCIKKVNK